MRFRTSEIALVVGGELVGPDVDVDGVRHDSREVTPGDLFVPFVDVRDGHDFIAAALASGAAAYLTERDPQGGTAIRVRDAAAALSALGAHARSRLPAPVVGITGSVGKTSCKDLAAAVFGRRYRTQASLRSFNNELGVPLTLANAPDGTEATIIEMGARGLGHIADLCAVASPTVGIVTTVELVHTELFGDLAQVALAKGELIEALPPTGAAVLNGANPLVAAMAARAACRVVTFGAADSEVRAADVVVGADLVPSFRLESSWGAIDVRLGVRGVHQVANALAAAAAALVCEVSLAEVAEGLADAALSPWRMDLVTTPSGLVVLNDAYNAGPASMEAAVRSLAQLTAAQRVAVLGPMAELGDHAGPSHLHISALAGSLGILVIAVDAPDYGDGPGVHHVADLAEAQRRLEELVPLAAGTAVLVKGSRVAGMERLAAALTAPA